jgi:methylated-DNA-[protein]-cysteine S-methyltransferase
MLSTHRTLARDCTAQTLWSSPLGPLLLARTVQGLAGAWFIGQKDFPSPLPAPHIDDDPLLVETIAQLDAYFRAHRHQFDLPLDLRGTPFQQAVWQALLRIPAHARSCYSDVAREIGLPLAARAVGVAIGRNPVGIIVPCHRVLGRDGSLTGYAGGLDRKRALLALEDAMTSPQAALI